MKNDNKKIKKVIIKFKLDFKTIEGAVRDCLSNGKKPTISNVKRTIDSKVYSRGMSIIDFPEYWGDDIWEFEYPKEEITNIVTKISKSLLKWKPHYSKFGNVLRVIPL